MGSATLIEVSDANGTTVMCLCDLEDKIGRDNVDYIWDTLAETDIVWLGEKSYRIVG